MTACHGQTPPSPSCEAPVPDAFPAGGRQRGRRSWAGGNGAGGAGTGAHRHWQSAPARWLESRGHILARQTGIMNTCSLPVGPAAGCYVSAGSSAAVRLASDTAAVAAAVAALRIRPLGPDERRRLLRRLLPAGGWLVHGDSRGASYADSEAETAARVAACAAAVVCTLPQVPPPSPSLHHQKCVGSSTQILA